MRTRLTNTQLQAQSPHGVKPAPAASVLIKVQGCAGDEGAAAADAAGTVREPWLVEPTGEVAIGVHF